MKIFSIVIRIAIVILILWIVGEIVGQLDLGNPDDWNLEP